MSEKRPTLFSLQPNSKIYYADASGVRLMTTTDVMDFPFPARTWALIDSGERNDALTAVRVGSGEFYLIQTSLPDESRESPYKEWLKQRRGSQYFMNPWCWEEFWVA